MWCCRVGTEKSKRELVGSFRIVNEVVVQSKEGTCHTTCSLKDPILTLHLCLTSETNSKFSGYCDIRCDVTCPSNHVTLPTPIYKLHGLYGSSGEFSNPVCSSLLPIRHCWFEGKYMLHQIWIISQKSTDKCHHLFSNSYVTLIFPSPSTMAGTLQV